MKINNKIHTLTDEELVAKIVETNNSELFGVLYDRFEHLVYNKCYGFANSKDEAKDLTHDVFVKLFMKLGSYRPTHKFSSWLFVFTYNLCVNYVNRNTSKKIENNAVPSEESGFLTEEVEDQSLFQLKVQQLKKVLNLLPADDKMILLLKYQDNISIKELASMLTLSESAVKMRLKRAKAKTLTIYEEKFQAHEKSV